MPVQLSSIVSRRVRQARAIARLIGAILGMVLGVFYGVFIISHSPHSVLAQGHEVGPALLGIGVAGAASMALAAPLLTVDPFLWLQRILYQAAPAEIIGGGVGLMIALAIAALTAVLLGSLPFGIGFVISFSLACVLVYVGVQTGTRRKEAFVEAFRQTRPVLNQVAAPSMPLEDGRPIVVDTSSLIDGRIADVVKTGFIQGRLLIPHFVLEEVQKVADSGDPIRRARGRRGLGVAEELRRGDTVVCEVIDVTFPGIAEVDSMLLKLCRLRNAALMTQDFNLNRIAAAEDIRVLNLNDLANAIKIAAATGETIDVRISKEGRSAHQGVGFLDDGTMVVVEQARDHLDSVVTAQVTSVLQTSSGRMIFAVLAGKGGGDDYTSPPKPKVKGRAT